MKTANRELPADPLRFIQERIRERRILWTYHVNMRLKGRSISREAVLDAVDSYEIIEEYPDDKYLPSYLVLGKADRETFHALFAADVEARNVRVVTAYRPNAEEWEGDYKTRRGPR
jgi:hypothetical protein